MQKRYRFRAHAIGREATRATAPSYTVTYPKAHIGKQMYLTPIYAKFGAQSQLVLKLMWVRTGLCHTRMMVLYGDS